MWIWTRTSLNAQWQPSRQSRHRVASEGKIRGGVMMLYGRMLQEGLVGGLMGGWWHFIVPFLPPSQPRSHPVVPGTVRSAATSARAVRCFSFKMFAPRTLCPPALWVSMGTTASLAAQPPMVRRKLLGDKAVAAEYQMVYCNHPTSQPLNCLDHSGDPPCYDLAAVRRRRDPDGQAQAAGGQVGGC